MTIHSASAADTAGIVLEPAVQELADATSHPPFVYELDYVDARKVLDDLQSRPVKEAGDRRGLDHRPVRPTGSGAAETAQISWIRVWPGGWP